MTKNIQRTASVYKQPDPFTRNQFVWLRQVAADVGLPPTASRVAIALTCYFNREQDGAAWMSQATLARDLGISERTVRDALASLVERGHVLSKRRGMKETNLYFAARLRMTVTGNPLPVMTGRKLPIMSGRKLPLTPG